MIYVLTKADLVWNRAMSDHPGSGVGDRHLCAMAEPYGRIMGSGVSAVMDTSSPEEVQQAAEAFDYLGLSDLAALTRRLVDADWCSEDDLEDRLNRTFWGLEHALDGAFERKYAESPEDFDAVVADGVDRQPGSWSPGGGHGKSICVGELIVHERDVLCSQRDACPGIMPVVLHSRSRLHSEA
ncbi:hypothetical protein ACFO1B_13555 [Dactylosporangium siamense]|uniref:Uncharacterized protein n=1 Tax=Dactylosporangium siamense TaxID=685454 RepID=A0A919PW93_9ACTN|nr:hypothetical protein [Dactylosporangium siamense]GIG49748.1 hypothetical protein Dsi01nite_077890 [Dactylosporangium siamense]